MHARYIRAYSAVLYFVIRGLKFRAIFHSLAIDIQATLIYFRIMHGDKFHFLFDFENLID